MASAGTIDRRRHATGAAVMLGGLAVVCAAAIVAWSWRSQLPDSIATHWGISGGPDGYSSLGPFLGATLGIAAALVVAFGTLTWALGQAAVTRRIGAAGAVWVALFLSTIVVGTLDIQRGLPTARAAGDVNDVLLAAAVTSLVGAILVAILVPGDPRWPTTAAIPADAPRITVGAGQHAAWMRSIGSPAALIVGASVLVLLVALAVPARLWVLLVIGAVMSAASATLWSVVVRVDTNGLTVRSALGWPRYRVPLDEVVRSDVTQVSPVREFGGWGWRVGRKGRVGVVLRKGEALSVERTGGRSLVVTVDDAAAAAGLLNTLADRARQPG